MNREIKFRGKSVENDEWIYGDLKHNKTYSICYDKNDVYFEVDDKTVGQFTGSISNLYIDTTMQVEVLGNVFDNPEQMIVDDGNEENTN